MPIILIIAGLMLCISAVQNTTATLGNAFSSDLMGTGKFFAWFAAIFILGAVGYYKPAEGVSRLFIVLVILAMFLANSNLFSQFSSAVSGVAATPNTGNNTPAPAASNVVPIQSATGSN